jgi:hypothetical protein
MSDFVAKLRARTRPEICECAIGIHLADGSEPDEDCVKAADTITRLTAEVERLTIEVEAAKKFGGGFYGDKVTDGVREAYRGFARDALPPPPAQEKSDEHTAAVEALEEYNRIGGTSLDDLKQEIDVAEYNRTRWD